MSPMFDYKSYVQKLKLLKQKEEFLVLHLKKIKVKKTNLIHKHLRNKKRKKNSK
jgi:hypothetical protein